MRDRSSVMRPDVDLHTSPHGFFLARSFLARDSVRSPLGFTLVEMLIVLFLVGMVLALTVPRIVLGDDLSATGRKFIGTLRTLQRMAEVGQRPVKLYLDLDRGTYWAMVVDGREERRPLDAAWASPRSFPDAVRVMEVSVRDVTRTYGQVELLFFPNGRLDPATIYLTDGSNNVLTLMIDHLTGNVKTLDRRPEPTRPQPIPDRVKVLLRATEPRT
ncbi:MAG: prepilin-type N-terminal cleavage/methylation domain-containing protein [Nitrospira sp.]|nr:prepilin-type N-terminal cleavage/methylation domain-containing protein [Nitrospira sp.]